MKSILKLVILASFSAPLSFAQTGSGIGHAPWVGDTLSGAPCNGASGGYGPFDYTQRVKYSSNLSIVEGAHFTSNVENLISGNRGSLMGDIDYTLRAWPNHHRALNSAIRLRLRGKNIGWSNKLPPAECYLSRAVNYSPKDGVARMLFGNLYAHMDEPLKALDMYQAAEQISPGNEQIKYNMGLVLVDLKRYQEAKDYAVGLYSRGFPLPGLKRQLEKNGYWKPKAK